MSIGSSWVLIARIERVGARLRCSESLLGMLAALAGDAPEITAAISALIAHQRHIGAGVVLGSNVFNLAALLGLSAVAAGNIALHRRVIEMNGALALWIAAVCVLVVSGLLAPPAGLVAVLAVLVPYLAVLGLDRRTLARAPLPRATSQWLAQTIAEEELELRDAINPRRAGRRDVLAALAATLVVLAASVAMEHAASRLGARHRIPEIVTGGFLLAAVTSLPNAVAAAYLAARGRGAAVLSTALNSNALNVLAGLLIPAAMVGLGAGSTQTTFLAASYLALTALTLLLAYLGRGLRRSHGAIVLLLYAGFLAALILIS